MEKIIKSASRMKELFALLGKQPDFMYEDADLNESINNALFLGNNAEEIILTGHYTISDILYSRYYWYTKFLARYKAEFGADGGMEQIQFRMIEEMDLELEEEVDSDLLERIEIELGYTDG